MAGSLERVNPSPGGASSLTRVPLTPSPDAASCQIGSWLCCNGWRSVLLLTGTASAIAIFTLAIFQGLSLVALLSATASVALLFAFYHMRHYQESLLIRNALSIANESLGQRVADITTERNRLAEQVSSLRSECTRMQENNETLEQSIQNLGTTREEIARTEERLREVQTSLEAENQALTRVRTDMEGENRRLEEKINELGATRGELERIKNELEATKEALQEVCREFADERKKLATLRDQDSLPRSPPSGSPASSSSGECDQSK